MAEETSGSDLQVVFGASGGLGNAVVRLLAAKGKRVRAVNRSGQAEIPRGVEILRGDAADPESARGVCEGAAVVFHCVNAPYTDWSRAFPPLTGNILEAAASAGAKLVFGDNLYMYGPVDGPITEDLPYAATDRKGRTRALMANKLMEAHKAGKVPVAIGRAPDFYGPGVTQSVMGARVFRPALKGNAISLLGDPDTPHTYAFVDDFARGLITLSEREEAFGRIWHTPSARTLTTRQFLELVFEQTGNRVPIRVAPRLLLTVAALFNPMVRELKDILYQWEQPFIVDHSKFEQAFGSDTTTHRNAIRHTIEWYRAH